MAIKKSDAVKFVYVNGNSLPSKVDDATIYIIGGTQELYVGNLKIAASIDVDSALSATSTNPAENQAITKELNKKATIESPTFTGIPNASTAPAGTSTTQIATTAFVQNAITASTIIVDSALNSTSTNPVQNKVIKAALDAKAALASPTFTGTPKAPTAAAGTNTTQIATTAFVKTAIDNSAVTVDSSLSDSSTNPVQNKIIKSALDGKANTGDIPTATSTTPKANGTAAVGSETKWAKGDHVHPSDTTKANLASPTFTGTPKAPTASKGTSTTQLATTAYVQNELVDYIKDNSSAPIAYGTCDTAADVDEKIITLSSDNPDWELEVGSLIAIRFTAKNTATSPTFNVNGTGAKPIGYNTSDSNNGWAAGEANVTSLYVYNGTCYMWLSHSVDNNTTYTNAALGQGYATSTPPTSGVAVTATLSSYALTVGGVVVVKFNTNPVPASATLNINSKGAKAIYYRGVAISANTILAGDTATFIYNGSQYHLVAIDRWGNEATSSNNGLMSAADKTKLDAIESGANKTVVDDTISSISTNPVQNKVVKQAIDDAIAASDAMVFKGTLGTGGTITSLPTTYSVGWTYRVITAGTYAGNVCEVGDLIIALVSRSGNGNVNTDWTVAQTNIDGAITNITGTSPISVTGSGTDRTIAHADSGVIASSKGDTTNQTPTFGGTFKVPSATVDAKGHLTSLDEHTVEIPSTTATTSSNGLMSSSDKTKLDGIASGASVTGVKGNAENSYRSGDVNLTATNVGALPITGGTVTGATTVQGIITAYRESDTASDLPAEIRFSVKDTDTGKTYPNAKISAYQDHNSGTSYGTNMVIFSGGAMFLGSGEASENHYNAWKSSQEPPYLNETMYLTSDGVINIQANANTIEDRKGVRVNTAGALIPIIADEPTDNALSIGAINYKWNAMYASTFYGDLSGSASTLGTARTIDGVDFDGSANIVHYGTCSTAAGTAAKVVSCTSYKLATGSVIRVKFTVTNTATSPTLNVNGTGAKNIFYKGVAITAGYLIKDHVYEFVYDGAQYCLVGEIYSAITTNIGSATSGTAIAADDITAWSAGTAASASVSGGVLTITNGTAPSLDYTARSIPNISVENKSVVTSI